MGATAERAPAYAGASQSAIQHHYDLSNDFFGLWLDRTRTYSCALWGEGDDLEAAQLRKLDYVASLAGAPGASQVLDVGCGWGSMLRRLVDHHGVERAVGLTLADEQAAWIERDPDPRIEVRVENWADHSPAQPYDAVVSIGAFEHFAAMGLPRAERIASYREFFRSCRSWLRPGGRLGLQTNAKGSNPRISRQTIRELRFIAETIFPESELPWLSEIAQAAEKLFEIESVRNDAPHYARTCAAWLDGLRANRARAVECVGEETVERYERYLSTTVGHFERGHLALLRIGLVRA